MIVLGIDPGRNGAAALLVGTELQEVHGLPDTLPALEALLLRDLPAVAGVVLEKPIAMPHQSVRSTATVFRGFGHLEALLGVKGCPVLQVAPSKWKKTLDLGPDKTAARNMAGQLFPDAAHLFARVKDDGRAEASLLAWWGRNQIKEKEGTGYDTGNHRH